MKELITIWDHELSSVVVRYFDKEKATLLARRKSKWEAIDEKEEEEYWDLWELYLANKGNLVSYENPSGGLWPVSTPYRRVSREETLRELTSGDPLMTITDAGRRWLFIQEIPEV